MAPPLWLLTLEPPQPLASQARLASRVRAGKKLRAPPLKALRSPPPPPALERRPSLSQPVTAAQPVARQRVTAQHVTAQHEAVSRYYTNSVLTAVSRLYTTQHWIGVSL